MNIRKHWKRLLLTTTALFWASCTSENENTFPTIGQDTPHAVDPGISSDSNIASSSENAVESSSSEAKAPSSSSEFTQVINPEESSSSAAESSSSQVSCMIDGNSYFYKDRSEKYTESQAISHATTQVQWDAAKKIGLMIQNDLKSKGVPQCLQDMQDSLERSFVALYGAPGTPIPSQYKCSDGTTIPTESYLEQKAFDEEQAKKKPQYDEKYNEVYKEETEKFDKRINDCLNDSNAVKRIACEMTEMCPLYGVNLKCSFNYKCDDGISCQGTEGENDINCTDKQGEKTTYTKKDFDKKYYTKENY